MRACPLAHTCYKRWVGIVKPYAVVNGLLPSVVCKHHLFTPPVPPCQPYPAHLDIIDQEQDQIGRRGQDELHSFCSNIFPTGVVFGGPTRLGDRSGEGGGDCWRQGSLVAVQVTKYTFVEYFPEVYEFAIWRREKGESVSEVEDSDNCCLIDVLQLSPSQNF